MATPKEEWEKYLLTVPGLQDAVSPEERPGEDDEAEYRAFAEGLPDDIVEALGEEAAPADEPPWDKPVEHQWCLCEMPEGEFPRVHSFSTLRQIVKAIAEREGQETAVWALFGVPLPLTKATPSTRPDGGLTRHLILPNRQAAVVSTSEAFQLVDQSSLVGSLEPQDKGWLGKPELLEGQSYYLTEIVEVEELPPSLEESVEEDFPEHDDNLGGYGGGQDANDDADANDDDDG